MSGGKWSKEISWCVTKTKLLSFKNTAKSVTARKNNKQHIVKVNRDILNWLINLWASSEQAENYEKAMEYSLLAVPLNITLSEGGRHQTAKSKMLEIVAIPLTTPPNSPEIVISVDPNKLSTLIIDLIGPIRTTTYQLGCWYITRSLHQKLWNPWL